MNLPPLFRIRQRFPSAKLSNVSAELRTEFTNSGVLIKSGTRIAIAVGSRGIANLPVIVSEVAAWVKSQGGEPFIVPAMGSHGGATAEGQRRVLVQYGITGTSILSSMEVVSLGTGAFMDKHAFEADAVIVINRIKPHTSFHGRYESGLMKMIAIGLGNDAGARAIHAGGVDALRERMPAVARQIISTGKILFGVAIVENAYDQTMSVRAIPGGKIPDEEPALLDLARANMPRLPVEDIDVLIVDEIGKDISGTGMDTNVIGRMRIAGQPEPESPRIRKIVVPDLSPGSGGSAYGIGLADVTTRRLADKTDWNVTNANVAASGFVERGKLPLVVESDEQALVWASAAGPRVARIKNTLHLETLIVSEELQKEIAGRNTIEVIGPAKIWDSL